jgi:hypothetical protein
MIPRSLTLRQEFTRSLPCTFEAHGFIWGANWYHYVASETPTRADEICRVLASEAARVCLLLDNSGQSRVLARDGLSANDPKRTFMSQLLP